MKWCCITFKSWYEAAGKRGFAILVGRDSAGKPQFTIQHRSIDPEMEDLVKTETPLSLVADIQISYCPWCGRNLERWYGKNVDTLYRPNLKITYA
jgi:hypothetical protein